MLGLGHPHEPRVRRLLEETLVATNQREFDGFGDRPLALEVVLRYPGLPPSDATNYLGGIADVLGAKARRGPLDHLGNLASVALYDNYRQLRDVELRHETGYAANSVVQLHELDVDRVAAGTQGGASGFTDARGAPKGAPRRPGGEAARGRDSGRSAPPGAARPRVAGRASRRGLR